MDQAPLTTLTNFPTRIAEFLLYIPRKIADTFIRYQQHYKLFLSKAYQHLLFTNVMSLAAFWLCFTTYPLILFVLYARLQQQVVSDPIGVVVNSGILLGVTILLKNLITITATNYQKNIATDLSERWSNEICAQKSIDAIVQKKKEKNNPINNIKTFCSKFLLLNQQLIQNLNKVTWAVLFIVNYCTPAVFMSFLGLMLLVFNRLNQINKSIKTQQEKMSELENISFECNENAKQKPEEYIGNQYQNDNRCTLICENNENIKNTQKKINQLSSWRDWIANSCENSITPVLIISELASFRALNMGVGMIFQLIQSFERCSNLFTQNGDISTQVQSSYSIVKKLDTHTNYTKSTEEHYATTLEDILVSTLITCNVAALINGVTQTITTIFAFILQNPNCHLLEVIRQQALSPNNIILTTMLCSALVALHLLFPKNFYKPTNTDITIISLSLTGLAAILTSNHLLIHSIPCIIGTPFIAIASAFNIALHCAFRVSTHASVKTQVEFTAVPEPVSIQEVHDNLSVEIKGDVVEKVQEKNQQKNKTLLSIPTYNKHGFVMEEGSTLLQGDMGSGKSTLLNRIIFQAMRRYCGLKTEKSSSHKFFGEGTGNITIKKPPTLITIYKPQEGDPTGTIKRPTMNNQLHRKLENYRNAHPKIFDYRQENIKKVTELQKYFYPEILSQGELPDNFAHTNDTERTNTRIAHPKTQLLDLWPEIHQNMLKFIDYIPKVDTKVRQAIETQDLGHICDDSKSTTSGFSKKTSGGNRCVFNAACYFALLNIRVEGIGIALFLDEPFNGAGDTRPTIFFHLLDAVNRLAKNKTATRPMLGIIAHEIPDSTAREFNYVLQFDPVGKTGKNHPPPSFKRKNQCDPYAQNIANKKHTT